MLIVGLITPFLGDVFLHGKNGSIRSIKVKIEIIETPDNIRVYIDDLSIRTINQMN